LIAAGFDAAACARGLPWAALAVVVVLAATFLASRIAGKHSVIDVAWGLLFAAIAVATVVSSAGFGDPVRRILLAALPVLWGLRLAVHIGRRTIGAPEDPRYEKLLSRAPGNQELYAIRVIYLLQGVLALLVSAPILVGAFERGGVGVLAWIGVGLWVVGVAFEAIGDRQLEQFRSDPANHGHIMDRGLWAYTRHPNYFGDACVWWGIFLVAAQHWPGVLTLPAPILMTLLLTKGSGVRILEQRMRDRPGWADYARRTSVFIPLPRKR
jgi:steroid 5-alpha reductase family enzyme